MTATAGRRPRPLPAPAVLATLALTAALAACGGPGGEPPPNVVLVVIDSLRADHLGAYGYQRPTSPHLDALAADGVLFEQTRAASPCTRESMASLLSSRAPDLLPDGPRTAGISSLPAILAEHGWGTLAISASLVVRDSRGKRRDSGGFGGGFDLFLEDCAGEDAACVNRSALAYLPMLRQPFFLYLHYQEPHPPYEPPAGGRRFAGAYDGDLDWVRRGDPGPLAAAIYGAGPGRTPAPAELGDDDLAYLVGLYDDTIAVADAAVGEVLAALDAEGLAEDTLVVVVSDHGQSLLDHGHLQHCVSLYDSELRVPWLVRQPGGGPPRRIVEPVSLVDVAPTVLALVGIDPAPYGLAGAVRLPETAGGALAAGTAHAVLGARHAVTDSRFKLIRDLDAPAGAGDQLYDLATDAGERHDLLAGPAPSPEAAAARDHLAADLDRRLQPVAAP